MSREITITYWRNHLFPLSCFLLFRTLRVFKVISVLEFLSRHIKQVISNKDKTKLMKWQRKMLSLKAQSSLSRLLSDVRGLFCPILHMYTNKSESDVQTHIYLNYVHNIVVLHCQSKASLTELHVHYIVVKL